MSLLAETLRKHTTLSERKVKKVVTAYQPFVTKRNQTLLRKGNIANYLYFVEKGCLRVFITDESGNQFTRFLIEEGMDGTAFPSFIQRKPSSASIQCIGKCEVLRISYTAREQLYEAVPEMEKYYRKIIELAYVDAIHRIESLISMNAQERYQLILKEKPRLLQQLPANVIAEYMGISKETLSRLKSKK
jgi:CRP/FNR family transcriptional regulator, cyclic AMP receptor protein